MKGLSPVEEATLAKLVSRAKDGDPEALDSVIGALQHDIFGLALRMTANREDAEDATQEILVKVVTGLGGFRGDSSIRTWAYRIGVRHVLDRRKSRVEALSLTFERFGEDLLEGLAAKRDPDPVLAEEVKRGCTLAMLTCLDREHRLAFVLSDVFDMPHAEAADLCDVSADVYHQRLSRARRALEAFTRNYCGLVNDQAPCRCGKRVARAAALGRLHRSRPELVALATETVSSATLEMEGLHSAAQVMRQHLSYVAPERVTERLRGMLSGGARTLLSPAPHPPSPHQ